MGHLTPEQLLDIAEDARPGTDFPHLSSCQACARQVAELRDIMAVATGVEVPEPSPLFWGHLSARVREAVAEEQMGAPGWWARWGAGRIAAMAAAVAVLVWIVAGTIGRDAGPAAPRDPVPAIVEYTPMELVPFEEDPALTLLADLSSELDWEAAAEAGLVPSYGAVDKVVLALKPEERLELQRILEEALSAPGA